MFTCSSKWVDSLCVGFIICGGVAFNTFGQTPGITIGFVDLQRVIDSSEVGKHAQQDIQQKANELGEKVKTMKAQINVMKEEYDKQQSLLTVEAKTEKRDAISKMEVEYDRFVKDSEQELIKARQRALQQLLEEIGKLVVEYGKTNNFALILEAGNILYGSESIEITNDIIQLYNSRQ